MKRFDFFSSGVVHALDAGSASPVCCAAGFGLFALGLADEHILVFATNTPVPKPTRVHAQAPIRALCAIDHGLISAHDNLGINVWRGSPLTKERRAVEDRRWPGVTCVSATADGRNIAVGLSDGHVVLLLGSDVCRMLPPARPSTRIQGVGFSRDGNVLWVASDSGVWTHVDGVGFDVLDTEGCAPQCGTLAPDDCFAVAQPDRIALFTTESQGSCYAVPGDKVMACKAGGHVAVVFQGAVWRPKLPSATGASNGGPSLASTGLPPAAAAATADTRHTLQVLDLQNKIIAHEFALGRSSAAEGQALMMCGDDASGAVFLVTSTMKVWRFAEKAVETKLEEMVKRNLYATAIAIARSSSSSPAVISDLYQRYGDHLYDKGNFDDAVAQYVRTIGRLEASYVIRKFLDAPRLRNLTTYLQALLMPAATAAEGEPDAPTPPSPDLTTLLLNCYTRLKDDQGIATLLSRQDARMDVDAALAVLRDTRRVDQALALAKERKRHAWYVRAVLDAGRHAHAVTYLAALPGEDALALLQTHAAALMQHEPQRTTQLLIEHVRRASAPFPADAFLDVLVDHPDALRALLMECVQVRDNLSPAVWATLLELCVRAHRHDDAMAVLRDPRAKYDVLAALSLMKNFRAGELYLLERSEMWDALLSAHMADGGDPEQVLAIAQQRADMDVWMRVLAHFSRRLDVAMVKRVLRHVDDVLPPLLVLRILGAQPQLPLEAARAYLAGQIERAATTAAQDESEVAQLQLDTAELRRQARALREEPRVFSATVCAMTGAPLELPAVHFLTMNSYNLSSLPSGALERLEDPKCAAEQRAVFDIARGLQQRRADVDVEFFDELDAADNSEKAFSLAADFFGKCLFSEPDEDLLRR